MQSLAKPLKSCWPWAAACLSAVLLELPFPLAGPMPAWRSTLAWLALAPLLWALLGPESEARPIRRGFGQAYLCGALWYAGNCYWIYNTMYEHGGVPPVGSVLLLIGFSLVLGLYFGLFGGLLALVWRATGSRKAALASAPLFWAALELAASRITSVPWDQLGYSQVDNALLMRLPPITGVYGVSFLLVAGNALLAAALLPGSRRRLRCALAWLVVVAVSSTGLLLHPAAPEPTARAVLMQPNLNVGGFSRWDGPSWDRRMEAFARAATDPCQSYLPGMPEVGLSQITPPCPAGPLSPDLVAWPESPAPFVEKDPRFQNGMALVAASAQAPLVIGGIGVELSRAEGEVRNYNSAMVFSAAGQSLGRYDKIHLVPYGEFIPFQELFSFAHKLTQRVSSFTRGRERRIFRLKGHDYGVFICYESVFAVEVRQFAKLGAEVFVNLSDDGWYGDTSAPWQHLNMARMRAIENRRWILRSTNDGVTASIDPYGRVRQSIPRHIDGSLAAGYGFVRERTLYTLYGDLFAWGCAILSMGIAAAAVRRLRRSQVQSKVRS